MRTRVLLGLLLAGVAGMVWLLIRGGSSPTHVVAEPHPQPEATPSSLARRSYREPARETASSASTTDHPSRTVATVVPSASVPANQNAPAVAAPAGVAEIETALDEVQTMFRDYRSALGENPIGTNSEIMRAINGDNLKQVKVGAPAGQGLNAQGELIDLWGTPYFFHQISSERMEIRSAGPDRVMWTGDDRQM